METIVVPSSEEKNDDLLDDGDVDKGDINKSKLGFNIKHDSTDATESSSEEKNTSESGTASVYSTKDADVIHQRQKEKRLKKKSLSMALRNIARPRDEDEESDYCESQVNASVGTSKISEKSFRAIRNLERFKISVPPYKACNYDDKDDRRIEEFANRFGELSARAKNRVTDTKLAREAAAKWLEKTHEIKPPPRPILYEPTYRIEPKEKIRINAILNRLSKAMEILVRKNEQYDVQYTPRFARTACELFKNDIKQFKYDRYKIIVHLIVLQKVVSQSCLVTSACLWNQETDKKFFLKYDTKSFYAICYVFMVYHE